MNTKIISAATMIFTSALIGCATEKGTHNQGAENREGKAKQELVKDQLTSYQKPGFVVKIQEGRLWVFREGSKELQDFEKHGELAKHVTKPGAGPDKMTIKAPDTETIDEYMSHFKK